MSAIIAAYKKCSRWSLRKDTPSAIPMTAVTMIKVAPDGAEIYVTGEKTPFRLTSAPDPFMGTDADLMGKFTAAGIKPVAIYAGDGKPTSYVIPGAVNYIRAPQDRSESPSIHMQGGVNLSVPSSTPQFILDSFSKAGAELVRIDLLNGNAAAHFMPTNVASITTLPYAPLGERLRTEWECVKSRRSSSIDRNRFTTVFAPRHEITFTDGSKIDGKTSGQREKAAALYMNLAQTIRQPAP